MTTKNETPASNSLTSLEKFFEVDTDRETQGVWHPVGNGIKVKVAAAENEKHQKRMYELLEPYTDQIREKKPLDPDVLIEVSTRAMAEAILVDWSGVVDDEGNEVAYTPERGYEVLSKPGMKHFRSKIQELAEDRAKFLAHQDEEAAKN